jgi:hypothetical protein
MKEVDGRKPLVLLFIYNKYNTKFFNWFNLIYLNNWDIIEFTWPWKKNEYDSF